MSRRNIHVWIFICLSYLALSKSSIYAQSNGIVKEKTDSSTTPRNLKFGLYVGALIANSSSAGAYNGYGFDNEGKRNSFENSWMRQKINIEYGGQNNSSVRDLIAEQLNVDRQQWSFTEADMPNNLRYNFGFTVGFNAKYSVDENNGIVMMVNLSRITSGGAFNITTNGNPINPIQNNIANTFTIVGVEQRMVINFGYQHIFPSEGMVNVFVEGGLNITVARMDKNFIVINNLQIELTNTPNDAILFPNLAPIQKPIGVGFGAFGGIGLNISSNGRYDAQLVYNPSIERIALDEFAKYTPQHSIGVRFYYNF